MRINSFQPFAACLIAVLAAGLLTGCSDSTSEPGTSGPLGTPRRAITALQDFYDAMCGRAYNPRMLWMWPNARISVMGGEQAASVLSTVREEGMQARGEEWPNQEKASFESKIRDQYEAQGHPYYSSARLWDDGVIDPLDTRGVLAHALSLAAGQPRDVESPLGIFRM